MTSNQAEAAERLWLAHSAAAAESRDITWLGIDAQTHREAVAAHAGDVHAAFRAQLEPRALAGEWLAICGMLHYCRSASDRVRWMRVQQDFRLADARRMGYRSVQILGADTDCHVCAPLVGVVVPSDTPAVAIISEDCPRLAKPLLLCSISTSPCIKRPDGSQYFDHMSDPPGEVRQFGRRRPTQ